jgi:hypothetical protein
LTVAGGLNAVDGLNAKAVNISTREERMRSLFRWVSTLTVAVMLGSAGGMVASASANTLGGPAAGNQLGYTYCEDENDCGFIWCEAWDEENECSCGCGGWYIMDNGVPIGEYYECYCSCGYTVIGGGQVETSYGVAYCYFYY